jgi:hypothetical protein
MLSMRLCAGLALSVAGALATAPGAGAATYCNDPSTAGVPECTYAGSPQQALNMAAAHPGFDTVVLGAAIYDVGAGLVYSDGGSPDNGLRIESRTRCPDRYTCMRSTLRGGAPGTAVLSLSGAGGADVRIVEVLLRADNGAIGLVLGPGARAQGAIVSAADAAGIRLDGTEALPAVVSDFSSVDGSPGVDAPGYGVVENALISGPVGARSRGDGRLDIRGGSIRSFIGVTGPRVRVTGTAIAFAQQPAPPSGSPVGIEAVCPDATSPDASAEITNVTIVRESQPGAIGVRALGRGGDGAGCDATARVSSSIVHDADVSLDAQGEAGSGADPRDGVARIEAAYSDFRATATRMTGPAEIETSSPGGNVDTNPGFMSVWPNYPLLWTSPLINAGDPAPPEEWQQPFVEVVHGRRDIGEWEYGFNRPELEPNVFPARAATDTPVSLYPGAFDRDPFDPLELVWTLPDRSMSSAESLTRTFHTIGRFRFHVKVTDPTGQVAEADLIARIVEQHLYDFRVRPARFRAAARRNDRARGAALRFRAAAAGDVVFRVQRATRGPSRAGIRWRRVPGKIDWSVFEGSLSRPVPFNGWVGRRRLRPGLYRVIATPRSDGPPSRARFRIIR